VLSHGHIPYFLSKAKAPRPSNSFPLWSTRA